jgi:hypothetical protein
VKRAVETRKELSSGLLRQRERRTKSHTTARSPVETKAFNVGILLFAPVARTYECDGETDGLELGFELGDGERNLLLDQAVDADLPGIGDLGVGGRSRNCTMATDVELLLRSQESL